MWLRQSFSSYLETLIEERWLVIRFILVATGLGIIGLLMFAQVRVIVMAPLLMASLLLAVVGLSALLYWLFGKLSAERKLAMGWPTRPRDRLVIALMSAIMVTVTVAILAVVVVAVSASSQ